MPRQPYQPRQIGGMVDIPQGPDPMQSMSSLMALGSRMESYGAQQQGQQRVQRVTKAVNDSKGDLGKAAAALEQQGDYVNAKTIRENAKAMREQFLGEVTGRVTAHKTAYGQARQLLSEVEKDPTTYERLLPQFESLAASIDPRLAADVPKTYEPEKVRGMIQFVEAGDQQAASRLVAAEGLKALQTFQGNQQERFGKERKVVGDAMSGARSQDDWDYTLNTLRNMGVSDEALALVPDAFSAEAAEGARKLAATADQNKPDKDATPTTIEGWIAKLQVAGDPEKKIPGLVKVANLLDIARRDPSAAGAVVGPEMVTALMQTPELWASIDANTRSKLIGPLQKAGFDFKQAAGATSAAQKDQIRMWRTSQIRQIRDRPGRRDFRGTDAEWDISTSALVGDVEKQYAIMMGEALPTAGDRRAATLPKAASTAAAAPPSGMTDQEAGDIRKQGTPGVYKLNDGTQWRLKADGTIEPVEK